MIISASRRTDLPAYYSEWLMNRIRAGYCLVPNPFNLRQVTRVSLLPCDVEVFVFWTRDARPMMGFLRELDEMGHRYMFLVTVVDYPGALGPGDLPVEVAIDMVRRLADAIGPDRVVWRYDPIVFSNVTDTAFHIARFGRLAGALRGSTRRVIVSGMSVYKKNLCRLEVLSKAGIVIRPKEEIAEFEIERLLRAMVETAGASGMELVSCAETLDWRRLGVEPGRCIDNELIGRVFGIAVDGRKDAGQRPECRCVISRDIGVYDTCIRGCPYCYAVSDLDAAKRRHASHDPSWPCLVRVPAN
ncbi:MAG: DUF1848 domain-containing protein [Verrucomicrobiia bacterium]